MSLSLFNPSLWLKMVDRISSLPDEIRTHILSFLLTKYSVRTTVLSRSWDRLYTRVPVLHFNFNDSMDITSFVHFVNSVFVFYNLLHMKKISLRIFSDKHKSSEFPIPYWISAAIHKNVSKIDININIYDIDVSHMLPRAIFRCKTLTLLRLKGLGLALSDSEVCLPCLKTCHLHSVDFDNQLARRLFKSCPNLEDLILEDWYPIEGSVVEVLDISVPTLKHFRLLQGCFTYRLVLNAPNLLYFKYYGPEGPVNDYGMESFKINPCLRTCHLSGVYLDNKALHRLFKSFPGLHDLKLGWWGVGEVNVDEVLHISSPTLKSLTLKSGNSSRIMLELPNVLRFVFVYEGKGVKEFLRVESLKSLVDASIHLDSKCEDISSLAKLVCAVSHVQRFRINDRAMEALLCTGYSLPTFNNLTRLEICFFGILSSGFIQLLDNSPRLEFLSLNIDCVGYPWMFGSESSDESCDWLPEQVPESVYPHLKKVTCKNFEPLSSKHKIVNFFTKHAKNLETLVFRPKGSLNEQMEISSVPFQIVFESDDDE